MSILIQNVHNCHYLAELIGKSISKDQDSHEYSLLNGESGRSIGNEDIHFLRGEEYRCKASLNIQNSKRIMHPLRAIFERKVTLRGRRRSEGFDCYSQESIPFAYFAEWVLAYGRR